MPKTRATLRTPADAIALAPNILGFHPAESLVMFTFGATTPFHSRVDFDPTDAGGAIASILAPAQKHLVREAVFVIYHDGPFPADAAAQVVASFSDATILVRDLIHYDGRSYATFADPDTRVDVDLAAHPATLDAAFADRPAAPTRAEVAHSIDEGPNAIYAGHIVTWCNLTSPWGGLTHEERNTRAAATRAAVGTDLSDDRLAWFVASLTQPGCRDSALTACFASDTLPTTLAWLVATARRVPNTPNQGSAHLLDLVGFAAWQSGNGALAWFAVDRSTHLNGGTPTGMADLLTEVLESAAAPSVLKLGDLT